MPNNRSLINQKINEIMQTVFFRWMISALLLMPTRMVQASAPDVRWVSVTDVLANPSAYSGKEVTIRGWVSLRHEDHGIWATKADYEKRDWRKCISLLNWYSDEAANKAIDRTEILVTGIFDKDIVHDKEGRNLIRLGACSPARIRFNEPRGLRTFSEASKLFE